MIQGLAHVGISVSNLESSVAFYRDLFGMQVAATEERFRGPLFEKLLSLKGVAGRVVTVGKGGFRLELFEFSHPVPRRQDPRYPVCDQGITHICLTVTDIEAEYQRLHAAGVEFHCAPIDFGGIKAVYARDPDGNVIELVDVLT